MTSVPVVFCSLLLSTTIPLIAAVITIASLATALNYVSGNQEKQIDNRCKLFTNKSTGSWFQLLDNRSEVQKINEHCVTDAQLKQSSKI